MALIAPVRLRVDDPSGVAPVRRAAEQLADDLGFDERRKGEAAIVVTELATNLVRHGGGGEIILRVEPRRARRRSTRSRPTAGRASRTSARAREDGYSTGGGPGNGLGAIGRLSATMDLQSGPDRARSSLARLGRRRDARGRRAGAGDGGGDGQRRRLGARSPTASCTTILLVDGLGHGDNAATAANAAVRELRDRARRRRRC